MKVVDFTALLCSHPHDQLIAVNSNYGHACQDGFDRYIKAPNKKLKRGIHKLRKIQGDGTCFNSAVEPIIRLADDVRIHKLYKVKCFPSTGETQVPGVLNEDFTDGVAALQSLVDYLNAFDEFKAAPIYISKSRPMMINYKFRISFDEKIMMINQRELTKLIVSYEDDATKATPYPITGTRQTYDDIKTTFLFRNGDRKIRVKIFNSGKVNILGADEVLAAHAIYQFIGDLVLTNWDTIIFVKPLPDAD